MSQLPDDKQVRQIVAALPPVLREILDRELAAGNGIAWAGGGHPAPPIGACVMLTLPLQAGEAFPAGVSRYARKSSIYTDEITTEPRHYWLLTPPGPPPEEPDMDAIRRAHAPPPFVVEPLVLGTQGERVKLDIRGETIEYHAIGRQAYVSWTYTDGHRLYRSSLTEWFDPEGRRWFPLSQDEGDRLFQRIARLARPLVDSDFILCD